MGATPGRTAALVAGGRPLARCAAGFVRRSEIASAGRVRVAPADRHRIAHYLPYSSGGMAHQ
jgi:hypothetical protein